MKILLLTALCSLLSLNAGVGSELENANVKLNSGQVPIDIVETKVQMTVSGDMRSVEMTSTTQFITEKTGRPVLFLRMKVEEATLNGEDVSITPTSLWMEDNSASTINTTLEPGIHTLKIKGRFHRNLLSSNQFITIDYINGDFTEQAIPANFLYDFYKLSIDFKLKSPNQFKLMSNGSVKTDPKNPNHFRLEFSKHFNSSYFFMDFIPIEQDVNSYSLISMDGRLIDVNVYLQKPRLERLGRSFVAEINTAFDFLELHLGPYPYDKIDFKVIDNNRGGAFAGALVLGQQYSGDGWIIHELGHSWFLKGVSPKNGFDGWFYEGFAEWARFGFPRADAVYGVFRRSIRYNPDSPNQKFTTESWDKGRVVLSHLDKFLEEHGGLVPLMKKLHAEKKGQAVNTDQFFEFLKRETAEDFTEFRDYYFR